MLSVGDALWWLFFILWSLLLVAADWRHRRVPNVLVVAGASFQGLWAGAAALKVGWHYPPMWTGWGMALLGFAMALLFVPLWMRRSMGAGDVKVIAAYGLMLGPRGLLAVLMIGSLLAGGHALLYLGASRRWTLPHSLGRVPYVTYLALAALNVALTQWNSR